MNNEMSDLLFLYDRTDVWCKFVIFWDGSLTFDLCVVTYDLYLMTWFPAIFWCKSKAMATHEQREERFCSFCITLLMY